MWQVESKSGNFSDIKILSLIPGDTEDHLTGSGCYSLENEYALCELRGTSIGKKRSKSTFLVPLLNSGDTVHAALVETDNFLMGFQCVSDGLSAASPYLWTSRLPHVLSILDKMARSNDTDVDPRSVDLSIPELAHAYLQQIYFSSNSWLETLEEVTAGVDRKIELDSTLHDFDREDPWPHLSGNLVKYTQATILGYSNYRSNFFCDLPDTLAITEFWKDKSQLGFPKGMFEWYVNAIFHHSLWVVPKLVRGQKANIIANSITSNADTLEVISSEFGFDQTRDFEMYDLRLVDPNRQPEQMIARLSRKYSPKSRIKERLLLEKPRSTYLTYRPEVEWHRNFNTLSTAWTEISSNGTMNVGAMTDGALFPNRNLDRDMENQELAGRISELGRDPSALLKTLEPADDATALMSKIITQ